MTFILDISIGRELVSPVRRDLPLKKGVTLAVFQVDGKRLHLKDLLYGAAVLMTLAGMMSAPVV